MKFKIFTHILILILIASLFEIFIFNYKTLYMSLPEKKEYAVEEYINSGFQKENDYYVLTKDNPLIELKNINIKTKTIHLDFEILDKNIMKYNVIVYYQPNDKTSFNYASNIEIINGYKNSTYDVLDFSNETSVIHLYLNLAKDTKIKLNSITLNERIPFHTSIARLFMLSFFLIFTYTFIMLFKYREELKLKKRLNQYIIYSLIGLSIGVIIFVFGFVYNQFLNNILQDSGTQLSKELVDMFKAGKVSLLEEPTQELKNLSNPYDPSSRNGIYYLWDHLYFEGKYYSYYGVTPVFILFLPINLITGKYLYDGYAVLLFSIIATIFMGLSYYRLAKKYFPKLPLYLLITGYILLFVTSGIFYNLTTPYFYQVSTSCGHMAMMVALYFMIKSNIMFKDEKNRPLMLVFASLFAGMSVLARATFVLYAIVFVIWGLISVIIKWKNAKKINSIFSLITLLLPIGICGIFQMVYNYLRFKNVLDFGIKYSLTINDFTNTSMSFELILNSIYSFLIAPAKIDNNLYFIHGNQQNFASGYYFFETNYVIGLFYIAPITLLVFLSPFTTKEIKFKNKLIWTIKYFIPLFIIPLIIVALTWESGFAMRYFTDFSWAMVLLGIFVFFYYADKYKEEKFATKFISVAAFLLIFHTTSTTVGHMLLNVPGTGRNVGVISYESTIRYYKIARELAFWL